MRFRTFKIATFGCRVNQGESRTMGAAIVKLLNCHLVDHYKEADLVIINTCCVTHKAEKEVRKEIRRAKRENPRCFLVVCGCWLESFLRAGVSLARFSQNKLRPGPDVTSGHSRICSFERERLSLFDLADLLIENKDKEKIGQILKGKFTQHQRFGAGFNKNRIRLDNDFERYEDKYSQSKKSLVKVQEGCDNFCTYCIVPYVRGRSKSKSVDEIIKEIKQLVLEGMEEVILTGTDISDYKFGLVKLIKAILKETKIKKISFGSINFKSFDDEFINLYSLPRELRLATHFHISLQSGCDETLKRMNRGYKISNFQFLLSKLKKKIPGFSFSTDIIVGFPGETENEFNQTLKTLKKIRKILGKNFEKIHVFRYSQREGTVAAKMAGEEGWVKVSAVEKKDRSKQIAQLFS